MGRVFNGVRDNGILRFNINTVLRVGASARLLQQRLNTTFFDRIPVAIERVSRQPHHLTGLRDVAEFFCQIEKSDFMADDFLITL